MTKPDRFPFPLPDRPISPRRGHLDRLAAALGAFALVAGSAACGSSSSEGGAPPVVVLDAPNADRCDPLDTRICLFPFPNDFYAVADAGTDTGLRLNLARESMPANVAGSHVDPTEWNRNDGFSPGALIETFVPGLDPVASGIAPVTDIGASLREDAPIVLVDADTGERKPLWAELDASVSSDEERALLIRPAVNLQATATSSRSEASSAATELRFLRVTPSVRCATSCGRTCRSSTPDARSSSASSPTWSAPASRAATSTSPGTSRSQAVAT